MNKYNDNYNNNYDNYNNEYDGYDSYNNNDYNGYDYNYNDENLGPKKKGPKILILVVIVLALIGVGGFYTYNAISSQLKSDKEVVEEVVENEYDEDGNVINKPNKEEGQEEVKEEGDTEEEVEVDPTENMTKEEREAYEYENSTTITIGGEVIPLTDSAQISQVKDIYNGNIEYILGNYFEEKVIASVEKDNDIKTITKDIKEMLPDFKVNIQTKEQDSKVSFVVKVDEVSFNKTYKIDVIQVDSVVEELTPEERAKEEEAKKSLGNN